MIDALIAGGLTARSEAGTSRNGNAYATARVLVKVNAEDRLSVSVIAFDDATVVALLAMGSVRKPVDLISNSILP